MIDRNNVAHFTSLAGRSSCFMIEHLCLRSPRSPYRDKNTMPNSTVPNLPPVEIPGTTYQDLALPS
jgi:hypothetical protein